MEDFSCNHSFDLSFLREQPRLAYLPEFCFQDVNPVSVSVLQGDVEMLKKVLEKGADANGVTEKGCPFFSPILLNSILHLSDWSKEKEFIETLLHYPMDVNMLSLCGLNLFHFFVLETILFPANFFKLEWWTKFPMVDVNAPIILYSGKLDRSLHVYHPVEWIRKIVQRNGKDQDLEEMILSLLFARGSSVFYGYPNFLSSNPLDWQNEYLKERLFCQWDVSSDDQLRYRIKNRDSFDFRLQEDLHKVFYEKSGISPTFTLNMNPIESIPFNHCLDFESCSGKVFSFHASFLESIFKKQIYPFTGEPVSPKEISKYIQKTQEKWLPREEFCLDQIRKEYPHSLNADKILPDDRFEFALQKLSDWISTFFPYTRIFQLKNRDERVFRFLFKEMNKGDFTFQAFEKTFENISWKEQFYWACHESLSDNFIFSNRIEELIGLLEIYDKMPSPFHLKFPFARMFIESDLSEDPLFRLYQEEYDLSFLQLYYSIKHLSIEISKD